MTGVLQKRAGVAVLAIMLGAGTGWAAPYSLVTDGPDRAWVLNEGSGEVKLCRATPTSGPKVIDVDRRAGRGAGDCGAGGGNGVRDGDAAGAGDAAAGLYRLCDVCAALGAFDRALAGRSAAVRQARAAGSRISSSGRGFTGVRHGRRSWWCGRRR